MIIVEELYFDVIRFIYEILDLTTEMCLQK